MNSSAELDMYGQWEAEISFGERKYAGRMILLPIPPSENKRLEPSYRGGRMHNSRVYNQWLANAAWLLKKGRLTPYAEECVVFETVVFPDARIRDGHNRQKALLDAFTQSGCVYTDDHLATFTATDTRIVKGTSFVMCFVVPRSSFTKDFYVSQETLEKTGQRIEAAKQQDKGEIKKEKENK